MKINEIPYWGSVFLSLFTYIVVVNAFNLIEIKERAGLKPVRIFETENWIVYSIR